MDQTSPTVLCLLSSADKSSLWRSWLTQDNQWTGSVRTISQTDFIQIQTTSPREDLTSLAAVDIVILDEPVCHTLWPQVKAFWHGKATGFLALLDTDDETWIASLLATGVDEYLEVNGLTPTRLRHTLRLLWQRVQAQPLHHRCQQQQQTIHELKNQKHLLRALLDNLPHIAWLKDCEGQFITVNAAFGDACGLSPAQVVGKTDLDIWPTELAQAYRADDAQVMASHQRKRVEEALVSADGHRQWIDTIKTPVFDEAGDLLGTVGMAIDVTDRKQLEQDLRDSQAKLADILQTSRACITSFRLYRDATWDYDYYSPGSEWIYGYPPEVLKTQRDLWRSRVVPEDFETLIVPVIQAVLAGETPDTVEFRFRHRDGSIRWIRESCAVRWEAGQQCWVVTTVGVDISDRKRHELERQQYEAALAQSEAKFRSLVENASEITYARSLNGNLLYISPQVEAVLGYKPEDLIGQNILDRLVHPEDRTMVDATTADLVVTSQSQRALEMRLRHRDGHWHWLRSNTSAIVNDAGAVVGIQGMSADIHDQKLAEQALQESRARFEAIYAQAAVGISLAALPSGQIILVNQCFCDFVGYSQQELLQMSYLDYTHPDDWQQDEALMTQLMAGEIEHFTLEKRFVRPSGEVRWGALTVSLVKDAEGRPLYDIAIIQDITERRQWQQAVEESQASVRRSEERLRTAMEAANMGSWHWHLDTNEVVWSETLERVMGLDPGSFDGRMETVVAMIYPADRSRVAAAIERSLHLGIPYDIEFRFIRPDGNLRWAATKGNSIRNGAGRVIAMAGVDIDITDRKRAEAALQESEARFRQLADTVREGFFVFEVSDDRYSYVNPAYLAITGFSEARLYGGGNPWVQGIHPADRDRVDILMQQELQGRPGETEYRFQRPDGTWRWLRSQSFPIQDDSGMVVRIVGTVADISDRKQAEISLQRNNTLLRAISAAQTQFITNADPGLLFDNLLETLLALTDSEYGFIGEILYTADGQAYVDESYMKMRGRPYLKTKAITNIAWNEETRRFYDEQVPHGMEFHNLKTLFGQVMVTGEPVIANHPSTDPRRGGLPDDHPPLHAFLGVPFFRGEQLVGMVGLANRPEGYDESIIAELGPFLTTCGSTIEAYRNEVKRQQAERALQRFNEELEQRVQRRTAALHQSEQDLRTIFNNVYDAIFIHDIDGTIVDVNDRALALLGATREQLIAASVADLTAVPNVSAQAATYLARAYAGESLQFEWSVRRFDHPSRFEAEVSLRGGTLGNRPVVIASVRDISHRKRLQAERLLQRLRK